MNKFQAMAQIMAILTANGQLKRGSQKYKIARKLIETRIDIMGPDAAYSNAKRHKDRLLEQIEELHRLGRLGRF